MAYPPGEINAPGAVLLSVEPHGDVSLPQSRHQGAAGVGLLPHCSEMSDSGSLLIY